MKRKEEAVEVDILKLARAVLKNIWAVILAAVIGGGAAFGYTYVMVEPTYEASALMYVNNNNISVGGANVSISSSSLVAAQELVNTYIVILKARTTINEIIEYADIDKSYIEVRDMLAATPINETEIFEVVVTSTDPDEAERIANAVTKVLPERIADFVDGSNVRIVDYAVRPSARSGPSYSKNTMLGLLAGIVISGLVIIISEMYDVFIREEEYLTETYNIPVLAAIPDSSGGSSGSYRYSKYSYKSQYYYSSERESKSVEGENK